MTTTVVPQATEEPRRIITRFSNEEDLQEFARKVGATLTRNVKELHLRAGRAPITKLRKNVAAKVPKPQEWQQHWVDMPEFVQQKSVPYAKIDVYIEPNQMATYAAAFEQRITAKTKSIWYPHTVYGEDSDKRWGGGVNGVFPIYIISKGRWDKGYTSRHLTRMRVPHYIVVEQDELEQYARYADKNLVTLLVLDNAYKQAFDACIELTPTQSKGSGPARNFCWDHATRSGFAWHWLMDDNINGFNRLNRNREIKVDTGAYFQSIENFVQRYENIAIAGLNYTTFCKKTDAVPPYVLNTRIYSCLFIRNDLPFRWRCRYNEDTDLSLRVLKAGWCTVQFNFVTAEKLTTQKLKGGNTDAFYAKEGTLPKSQMLQRLHPDVTKVVWRFKRWHHYINYKQFTTALKRKVVAVGTMAAAAAAAAVPINEYATQLVSIPVATATVTRSSTQASASAAPQRQSKKRKSSDEAVAVAKAKKSKV